MPKVAWSPDLGAVRVYRVLGARGLGGAAGSGRAGTSAVAEWACGCLGLGFGSPPARALGGTGNEETEGEYKFFRVVVEMP